MIVGPIRIAAAGLALLPASALAGAGTARPPIALTASPSHVVLEGTASATVHVANSGASSVVVGVSRASFALDLRGRPKVVAGAKGRRSAASWLTFRPRSLRLPPGASGAVSILSKPPPRAEPGDHDALLLFTTRRRARDGVAVRMRMGVVVVVRAPGRVVHRLALGRLRVARGGRARALELFVANEGNVTESIERSEAAISLFSGGLRVARLRAVPRELRPRTRGILQFRFPGRRAARRYLIARVEVTLETGRVVRRTFRVRA